MKRTQVIIVGAGLSGLYAAWLLARSGVDFIVLEARDRVGGRILSARSFDLGPSWFWPDFQPHMTRLVERLGLRTFAQPVEGDMLVERFRLEPPQRLAGYPSGNESMRIAGGTGMLVEALAGTLSGGHLLLKHRAVSARQVEGGVQLAVQNAIGEEVAFECAHVMLAMPPRIIAQTVCFEPPLNPVEQQRWVDTPTWMAPHAKYVAVYDQAFWRDDGLSGMAQSMVGPLVEIHDASSGTGGAALFGFIGLAAASRRNVGEDALMQQCRAQLVRLFGARAATPHAEFIKDWAADELTATGADQVAGAHGASATGMSGVQAGWSPYLSLAGSEVASEQAGYMEGALEAAQWAVSEWQASSRAQIIRP